MSLLCNSTFCRNPVRIIRPLCLVASLLGYWQSAGGSGVNTVALVRMCVLHVPRDKRPTRRSHATAIVRLVAPLPRAGDSIAGRSSSVDVGKRASVGRRSMPTLNYDAECDLKRVVQRDFKGVCCRPVGRSFAMRVCRGLRSTPTMVVRPHTASYRPDPAAGRATAMPSGGARFLALLLGRKDFQVRLCSSPL